MEEIQLEHRPLDPKTIEEAGISEEIVESLILKTIKQEGAKTREELSLYIRLNPNILTPFLDSLKQRKMLEVQAGLKYAMLSPGKEMCKMYEEEDNYVGPAPVSFKSYCEMVLLQDTREKTVTLQDVKEIAKEYQYTEEQLLYFKEAFNSRRSVFFFGPPGNGKSLVTSLMHALLIEPVLIPYTFEFNKKVVKIFDPAYHQHLEKEDKDIKAATPEELAARIKGQKVRYDKRWLVCKAPLVIVGTEFRVKHFEINFIGHFIAPPHLKANNGIFIFDDLGRQLDDHRVILNQFIYPLENQQTIIAFPGGSSLIAPYKQRLFLSTNLNKDDIIDDAFNRRLLYQIFISRPDKETYKKIYVNIAKKFGLDDSWEDQLYQDSTVLLEWYDRDQRSIRACDPRNLFIMMLAALDPGQSLKDIYNRQLLERIYKKYPMAYRTDEKEYKRSGL
ncbi:MAG: hypothetical protein AB1765_07765 [Candidatus Hydrogenedentota bacterium]